MRGGAGGGLSLLLAGGGLVTAELRQGSGGEVVAISNSCESGAVIVGVERVRGRAI